MSAKCKLCRKSVYPMDPQINLDGSIFHKPCAKCADCNCQITLSNFVKNESPDQTILLCKTHYIKRFHEEGSILGGERFVKSPIKNLDPTTPTRRTSVEPTRLASKRSNTKVDEEPDSNSVSPKTDGSVSITDFPPEAVPVEVATAFSVADVEPIPEPEPVSEPVLELESSPSQPVAATEVHVEGRNSPTESAVPQTPSLAFPEDIAVTEEKEAEETKETKPREEDSIPLVGTPTSAASTAPSTPTSNTRLNTRVESSWEFRHRGSVIDLSTHLEKGPLDRADVTEMVKEPSVGENDDTETAVGSLSLPNGDLYRGEFKDGKMHGQGVYTIKSGNVYVGSFVEGHMEGFGVLSYSNGDR